MPAIYLYIVICKVVWLCDCVESLVSLVVAALSCQSVFAVQIICETYVLQQLHAHSSIRLLSNVHFLLTHNFRIGGSKST